MEFLPLELNGSKVYAGFWKRLGAGILDILVFLPFGFIFYKLESFSIPGAVISTILASTVFSIYSIYFHYKFGATLGKMAVGIKVTLPNGNSIGLKNSFLRSSVDLVFSFFMVLAQIIAINNADPEQYLELGFFERTQYILPLLPAWYALVNTSSQVWVWGEFIVLLTNKRRRAIHDFIAGTVVIQKQFAEQGAQLDAIKAAPVS